MRHLHALLLVLALPLAGQAVPPVVPAVPQLKTFPDSPSGQLMKEIKEHNQLIPNLEYLCDVIGPRLTGSERLRNAQAWVMNTLKGYGATNVHEEPYELRCGWTRGEDRARLITHNGISFRVDQVAWSPGTHGTLTADLIRVTTIEPSELVPLKGMLLGKIALLDLSWDALMAIYSGKEDPEARFERFFRWLHEAGVKAILGTHPMRESGLSDTSSRMWDARPAIMPEANMPREPFKMLVRLLQRQKSVRMELSLGGRFTDKPVQVFNTVAEIRGSDKPEEVVIIGGHLDSHDLAAGAADNGVGSVAVMEVLRAIQFLGLKPRRTLRVIHWSGEEEGLLGSRAYLRDHLKEMDHVQAVLVMDVGGGMIKGFLLGDRDDLRGPMAQAIVPANDLGVRELPLRDLDFTDNRPFLEHGIPAFAALQERLDYITHVHHSDVDFPDHISAEHLTQAAQAMAVTTWSLLNMEERLPHRKPKAPAH